MSQYFLCSIFNVESFRKELLSNFPGKLALPTPWISRQIHCTDCSVGTVVKFLHLVGDSINVVGRLIVSCDGVLVRKQNGLSFLLISCVRALFSSFAETRSAFVL